MPLITESVRAGDVIASDLINRIIAMLNEHEARLESGGSGGSTAVIITGFAPATQQNIGRVLTIFGNFDFPLGTNALSIDGVPIAPAAFLAGSNNLQIQFTIPTTIVVTGSQKSTNVRIVNSQGAHERPYILLPEVPGLPNPTISNVRPSAGAATLFARSEEEAQIIGLNFIAPATDNAIQLTLNPGPAQTAFTLTAKSGSTIETAPTSSTLLVDMPVLTDTHGIVVGDTAPATVSVTVPGANVPATVSISLERTA
jgi:hypothetical protein